jgi:hypothetical protein
MVVANPLSAVIHGAVGKGRRGSLAVEIRRLIAMLHIRALG